MQHGHQDATQLQLCPRGNSYRGSVPNFEGKKCVLCRNPSTRVGEHVIPKWLITDYHDHGPFASENRGTPYTTRAGDVLTQDSLPSVHVPMCGGCNSMLDRTLEKPAKPVVRRLMPWSANHHWPLVGAAEVTALGRWLLKVGLLWAHPASMPDQEAVQRDPGIERFANVPPEWVDWMREGRNPPRDFTLFVSRRSPYSGHEPWPGQIRQIDLPRSIQVGARELRFVARDFSCIRGLDFTMVWHPGWPIRHPLVAESKAAVLWPDPGEINFALLREVYVDEFRFGTFWPAQDVTEDQYRSWAASHPLSADVPPVVG